MPSLTHEGLVSLFRNRPELAPELLRDALGIELPAYAEARVESADLTEVLPTEYRADLVVLLVDGKPVFGIVVEAQLELKEGDQKFFTWPSYVANLRAYLECETCVLVVTPSEAVAARASNPIRLGPGSMVSPSVVGPKAVPSFVTQRPQSAIPSSPSSRPWPTAATSPNSRFRSRLPRSPVLPVSTTSARCYTRT